MIRTTYGTKINEILEPVYFDNTGGFSGLLWCVDENGREIQIRLDALQATSEKDEKILEKYRELLKKTNPGTMPEIEEKEITGFTEGEFLPDEKTEKLPEEGVKTIEEPFFSEEELKEEEAKEEQPSLFEDDRVHKALCSTLDLIISDLKKVDKQIEHKQLEKSILINRKEEQELAIKDYEEQRSERE